MGLGNCLSRFMIHLTLVVVFATLCLMTWPSFLSCCRWRLSSGLRVTVMVALARSQEEAG